MARLPGEKRRIKIMWFYVTDTKKYVELTMRTWENGQWTPDFFSDLETNIPRTYKREEGRNAFITTSDDIKEIIEWWEEECRCMREGKMGDTVDYYVCKSETYLFVDEK